MIEIIKDHPILVTILIFLIIERVFNLAEKFIESLSNKDDNYE